MEKLLLRMLFLSCVAAVPFVLKRKNLLMLLIVFFAKGVLAVTLDSYFIKKKSIAYPARPFPKIFDTNILYDFLFYPLLSVIWVRVTYNSKPAELMLRSLFFSVPMSLLQWALEKKTKLFKWNSWTVLHTFASLNFTLFTIRGFVGLVRRLLPRDGLLQVEESKYDSAELTAKAAG
ncbi:MULTISPECIES: CBO0543 family protein [Paenibacillus]|uniref:CBO0543 family protein n=1 Tax=Paenibacillus violae TaxID=3077234 RepID=A0ABU3RE93_9BACL|nr:MULTISPECIES: CBO0543 family protein [Paenibacillus]MDU0202603.1 CBO0543 family protein [Paenibacillus sp. PFR10]MEC0271200.1 hypothetical protein [Paenibacillus anseongense]